MRKIYKKHTVFPVPVSEKAIKKITESLVLFTNLSMYFLAKKTFNVS